MLQSKHNLAGGATKLSWQKPHYRKLCLITVWRRCTLTTLNWWDVQCVIVSCVCVCMVSLQLVCH